MKTIDFHQHLLVKIDPTGEKLIRYMDLNKIEKTVLHACPSHVWGWVGNNEQVLKTVKSFPGRLIGSVYIDPRKLKESKETVKRYFNEGFKCVKMFPPVGFYPDELKLRPVFEFIGKLRLPVLFHTGYVALSDKTINRPEVNSKYAQPIYIDALARAFPGTNFVMAHIGVQWHVEAIFLSLRHKNLFIDCSPGETENVFRVIRTIPYRIDPDKLIWGRDEYFDSDNKNKTILNRWVSVLRKAGFGGYEDKIFYGNAKKILNI